MGQVGLRGVVRITTRGMWIDEGRMLMEIQKASEQALFSLRRNSTIVYIERAISTEIRKVRDGPTLSESAPRIALRCRPSLCDAVILAPTHRTRHAELDSWETPQQADKRKTWLWQAVRKYCKKKPDVICIAHESLTSIAEAGQLSTGIAEPPRKRRTIITAVERERRREAKKRGEDQGVEVMQSDAEWAMRRKKRTEDQ